MSRLLFYLVVALQSYSHCNLLRQEKLSDTPPGCSGRTEGAGGGPPHGTGTPVPPSIHVSYFGAPLTSMPPSLSTVPYKYF